MRNEYDGDDANDLTLSTVTLFLSLSTLMCFSDCQLSVRDLIAAISESSKKCVTTIAA